MVVNKKRFYYPSLETVCRPHHDHKKWEKNHPLENILKIHKLIKEKQ